MIIRDDAPVDLPSYVLYITNNKDEDSLVEVENYSLEDVIEEARYILKMQDPPSVITLYNADQSDELRVLESERTDEDELNIIIHNP